MICTTALTWQPAENIKVDDKKTSWRRIVETERDKLVMNS